MASTWMNSKRRGKLYNQYHIVYREAEVLIVARKSDKEIVCVVTYTEGCSERLTEALLDIYYNRQRFGTGTENEDETA